MKFELVILLALLCAINRNVHAQSITMEEAIRRWESVLSSLESIEVRTATSARMVNDSVDDGLYLINAGFFWEIDEFAWSRDGGKLMRIRKYWVPKTEEEFNRREPSTLRQVWSTFDGSRYFDTLAEKESADGEFDTHSAGIKPQATKNRPDFFGGNVYLEGVGSFLYDGEKLDAARVGELDNPNLLPFSIPEALRSRKYEVKAEDEFVAGIKCLKVESQDGQDQLWLSKIHNFAIVKREWKFANTPHVKFRYENSDLFEVSNGLWLPKTVKRTNMVRPTVSPEHAGTPFFYVVAKAKEIKANQASDELFQMSFQPGAYIVDEATDEGSALTYSAGRTEEATQRALDRSLERKTLREKLQRNRLALYAIGIVVVAVSAAVVWKWRK